MPQVGFEPTIPVFGRAKTVQALDRVNLETGENVLGTRKVVTPFACRYDLRLETLSLLLWKYGKNINGRLNEHQ
jgi:hypothetical protein